MKLSKLWLGEWVNCSLTAREIASQLTMAGLEVDSINPVAGEFNNVIVAQVIHTKPHPNADKLTLCEVNANTDKPLSIVCGAANVRPGLKVALAMIGAQLPGGFKIKESKLRGELSQGMLCSASELGLTDQSEGILELECDAPIGMDLRNYLMLDDEILEVDLTPNRADCLSVLGIAREVAVLNNLPLIEHPISPVAPCIDDVLTIRLQNPKACSHYCGRVIRQINPQAKTPIWMSERLRRSGIRSLHPVVDVMNYVMLELGQPMHAFDLASIKGGISVRLGESQEKITLLDGQTLSLNEKVLVIADTQKPLALAGVMGSQDSAVQEHTTDLFLESAFFNPISVAGVARKFGLFSDSSQRYERGVDPNLQIKALERATELILSIVGGKPGPVIEISDKNNLPEKVSFTFNTEKVKQLTGLTISQKEIKKLLEGLGIVVTREYEHFLDVNIPSYRFDLQQEVDLVEEIIRLYGYDNLPTQSVSTSFQAGKTCSMEELAAIVSRWLSSKGYHETISYSFVDPNLQEELYSNKEYMQLLNPISSELSQMRSGMWPGLIASMMYNIHRQQNSVQLFEVGVAFDVEKGELTERPCVAGLLMGEQGSLNWCESTRAFDFFDLKGDLSSLFAFLKLNQVEFVAMPHTALHPGQSALIKINDIPSGWIGVLHPKLNDLLELSQEIILFEINLGSLLNCTPKRYKAISKYPQIRRDLSFLIDESVNVIDVEKVVKETVKENWLKSFSVFDVYTGKGIPEGKKSLAIALILQDDARTLVDGEINSLINAIIHTLENKFSIILRD